MMVFRQGLTPISDIRLMEVPIRWKVKVGIWLVEKVARVFLDQSLNQNQSNPGSRSILNWILLYSKGVLFLSYLQNTPDFYM